MKTLAVKISGPKVNFIQGIARGMSISKNIFTFISSILILAFFIHNCVRNFIIHVPSGFVFQKIQIRI